MSVKGVSEPRDAAARSKWPHITGVTGRVTIETERTTVGSGR